MTKTLEEGDSAITAVAPTRVPLVPERSDFLEGDAPAENKAQAFLARALAATGTEDPTTAGALVPWICVALLSNHSVRLTVATSWASSGTCRPKGSIPSTSPLTT